ncbi:hypothetical protein ACTHQF_05940 [Pedobacter sp. SAFR-022]|uniref:hypothetical protein n=1 Tax=Pedobacter sp. SAFR-022 TaxID=3436861 RepID=UPI003F7ED053
MTDLEFTVLSQNEKIRVLSTASFIATNDQIPTLLFLVEDFFVEAFYDVRGNVLSTITYSSSAILPEVFLDLIALNDLRDL